MLKLYWKEFATHVVLSRRFYCTPYEVVPERKRVKLIEDRKYCRIFKIISHYTTLQLTLIWSSHLFGIFAKESVIAQLSSFGVATLYTALYTISQPYQSKSISSYVPNFFCARIKLEETCCESNFKNFMQYLFNNYYYYLFLIDMAISPFNYIHLYVSSE